LKKFKKKNFGKNWIRPIWPIEPDRAAIYRYLNINRIKGPYRIRAFFGERLKKKLIML